MRFDKLRHTLDQREKKVHADIDSEMKVRMKELQLSQQEVAIAISLASSLSSEIALTLKDHEQRASDLDLIHRHKNIAKSVRKLEESKKSVGDEMKRIQPLDCKIVLPESVNDSIMSSLSEWVERLGCIETARLDDKQQQEVKIMSDEKKLKVLVISLLSSLVFLFTPIS